MICVHPPVEEKQLSDAGCLSVKKKLYMEAHAMHVTGLTSGGTNECVLVCRGGCDAPCKCRSIRVVSDVSVVLSQCGVMVDLAPFGVEGWHHDARVW